MKRLLTTFIVLLFGAVLMSHAAAKPLRIITTTPELADLTRRIGGERVQVESLARGTEDIHNVPQRPSFVPKLNRADAVVLVGMELEHTFLPALTEVAQNPKILKGREGYIDCSDGLQPLQIPTTLTRAEGELHPYGNPHYVMDPRKGALIADNITKGLSKIDPQNRALYETHRDAFKKELETRLQAWQALASPLKGTKIVTHHKDMVYLSDFLGLDERGTVELKPGIPPTPSHLQQLIQRMKAEAVTILVREIQYSEKTADWIASQTGARVAVITTMGGAFEDTRDYFGFIDRNIRAILEAAKR